MTSSQHFAQNLKRLRLESGKTCVQFSALLGISKSTLYKLEKGTEHFSSATLDQIAGVLGIPPSELLGGNEPANQLCESMLNISQALGKLRETQRTGALDCLAQFFKYWA